MEISVTVPDIYSNPERFAAEFESAFWTELIALWRRYFLPAMRRTTPHRTGNLQRSMRIWREGNTLILGFSASGFYWQYQGRELYDRYQAIASKMLPVMADMASTIARQKLNL